MPYLGRLAYVWEMERLLHCCPIKFVFRASGMFIVPRIVNAAVICFLCAELVALMLGKVSPDQLLIGSMLSGVLTLISFKLTKEALLHLNTVQAALEALEEEQAANK